MHESHEDEMVTQLQRVWDEWWEERGREQAVVQGYELYSYF